MISRGFLKNDRLSLYFSTMYETIEEQLNLCQNKKINLFQYISKIVMLTNVKCILGKNVRNFFFKKKIVYLIYESFLKKH